MEISKYFRIPLQQLTPNFFRLMCGAAIIFRFYHVRLSHVNFPTPLSKYHKFLSLCLLWFVANKVDSLVFWLSTRRWSLFFNIIGNTITFPIITTYLMACITFNFKLVISPSIWSWKIALSISLVLLRYHWLLSSWLELSLLPIRALIWPCLHPYPRPLSHPHPRNHSSM